MLDGKVIAGLCLKFPLCSADVSALFSYTEKIRADGFRAGAASRDAEVARLKTVPMRYRRMAFNAQLQDEVARLEQENDQLRAQINVLRNAIEFWMRAEGNYDLMKADKLFQEALATTGDKHGS